MMRWLDKLNLRPNEKRLVVVVAVVVFIVLNFLFVFPHRNDVSEVQTAIDKAERTLQTYETEIGRTNALSAKLGEMQNNGSDVLFEELQLQRLVQSQAIASGMQITLYDPKPRASGGKTNQFFEDQNLRVEFLSDGKALVDFLASLATGNSMIRVREMDVKPDSSGTKLAGTLLFVASYQKKAPVNAPPSRVASVAADKRPSTAATNAPVKPAAQAVAGAKTNSLPAMTPKPGPAKPAPKL